MSSLQAWITSKLREGLEQRRQPPSLFNFEEIQEIGLRITRGDMPQVIVYCASVDSEGLTADDVERISVELPGVDFVAVVPTRISDSAYARADDLGICVEGFGELLPALLRDREVSRHKAREHAYVSRRLDNNQGIPRVRRLGHHIYELQLRSAQSVVLATISEYEITADDVLTQIEQAAAEGLDVISITNPSASGISDDAMTAGDNAGVCVALFADFLRDIRSGRWS